jgi:hypothetical protein
MRRARRVAATALATLALAACAPDSGTVYDRYLEAVGKPVQIYHVVCVDDGHGQRGCSRVNADEYKRCTVGAAWPACKAMKP